MTQLSERILAMAERIQKRAAFRSGDYNAALLVVAGELEQLAGEIEWDESIEREREDFK